MTRFEYKARDADGRVMAGELVAPDSQVAAQLIQDAGAFVVSISEARPRSRGWGFLEPVSIPLEERLFLLQSWSMLLKSGFPFRRRGRSGLWSSDLLPEIASCADELCLIRSMVSKIRAIAGQAPTSSANEYRRSSCR